MVIFSVRTVCQSGSLLWLVVLSTLLFERGVVRVAVVVYIVHHLWFSEDSFVLLWLVSLSSITSWERSRVDHVVVGCSPPSMLSREVVRYWIVYWQSLLFVKGVVHVVVGYIAHHGSCCCGMLNKEQNVFPETCFVFFMVVILSVTTVCQKGGGCCCRRLHYQHNGFQWRVVLVGYIVHCFCLPF